MKQIRLTITKRLADVLSAEYPNKPLSEALELYTLNLSKSAITPMESQHDNKSTKS